MYVLLYFLQVLCFLLISYFFLGQWTVMMKAIRFLSRINLTKLMSVIYHKQDTVLDSHKYVSPGSTQCLACYWQTERISLWIIIQPMMYYVLRIHVHDLNKYLVNMCNCLVVTTCYQNLIVGLRTNQWAWLVTWTCVCNSELDIHVSWI